MDTRGKIVPLEQLAARLGEDRQWLAAVGKFDPLTLAQAERLAALSGKGKAVLAVVEPDKASLLPVQARAALVAALKSVQAVVVAEANALAHYPQLEIFQDDEGERKRSAEFAEHVKRRQTAK